MNNNLDNNLYLNNELKNYLVNNFNYNLNNSEIIFNYFNNIPGEVFREVKSRVTKKIKLDQEYFIKIHYCPNLKNIIKETIKNIFNLNWPFVSTVSAKQEKDAIAALQSLNIKTLELAAYVNIKKTKNSFIITEAITPNISLDQLCEKFLEHPDFFKLKRDLIKYIAQNTRLLHNNGLNHRDYYLCHYLLKFSKNNLEISEINTENIYLIDLHRMQIRKKVPVRYLIKDLSGLLFSARNYRLTRTDYLRFIKYYLDISKIPKNIKTGFWIKVINKAASMREKG